MTTAWEAVKEDTEIVVLADGLRLRVSSYLRSKLCRTLTAQEFQEHWGYQMLCHVTLMVDNILDRAEYEETIRIDDKLLGVYFYRPQNNADAIEVTFVVWMDNLGLRSPRSFTVTIPPSIDSQPDSGTNGRDLHQSNPASFEIPSLSTLFAISTAARIPPDVLTEQSSW